MNRREVEKDILRMEKKMRRNFVEYVTKNLSERRVVGLLERLEEGDSRAGRELTHLLYSIRSAREYAEWLAAYSPSMSDEHYEFAEASRRLGWYERFIEGRVREIAKSTLGREAPEIPVGRLIYEIAKDGGKESKQSLKRAVTISVALAISLAILSQTFTSPSAFLLARSVGMSVSAFQSSVIFVLAVVLLCFLGLLRFGRKRKGSVKKVRRVVKAKKARRKIKRKRRKSRRKRR